MIVNFSKRNELLGFFYFNTLMHLIKNALCMYRGNTKEMIKGMECEKKKPYKFKCPSMIKPHISIFIFLSQ
jgi:hypothetical protein